MIKKVYIPFYLCMMLFLSGYVFAANTGDSILRKVTEANGTGCTGDNVSWDEGKENAYNQALRMAKEEALVKTATYMKSYCRTENKMLVADCKEAFSIGNVEITGDPVFSDPVKKEKGGYCVTVKIKALVTVDEKLLQDIASGPAFNENPDAFLNIRVSTDKKEYVEGDKIKIYVKANKDCYLDLLYIAADNKQYKIFPNRVKENNYVKGGQVHEFPGPENEFQLEIVCNESEGFKCGSETIIATASTRKIVYSSDTAGTPVQGTNISESKIDFKSRALKLIVPPDRKNDETSAEIDDKLEGETAQGKVVIYTKKK